MSGNISINEAFGCCVRGQHHSERRLGGPLGVEENIGLSVAHFLHTAHLHLRVVTVDPETCKTESGVKR